MNLYNVLLNNEIPFVLHESGDSENVIYCKSFSDYLFNVGTFVTKTKEVILEYVTEGEKQYIIADVTFENGECYRNVKFEVIINESIETPYSTINLNLLENKTQVDVYRKPQQIVEDVEETVEELITTPAFVPIIEAPDYTETINEALKLEKKLNIEKEEIRKQKILLEKQNLVNKKLQEYKQELLEEYVTAVDKQKQFLGAHVKETLTLAEHDLNERITNTFNEYNYKLEDFQSKSKADQLEFIIEKINDSIVDIKIDLNSLVSNKFTQEHDVLLDVLQAKSQLLQEKYEQKLLLELERYKEALFEEFRLSSQEAILQVLTQKKDLTEQQISIAFANREKEFNSSFEVKLEETSLELDGIIQEFSSKLPIISDNISLLETRLKSLLEEKKKSDEAGKFNTTQQKFITDTAQYWARRILDLGGGGGSVAQQFANGGTMNGNLNVTGNYLSAGIDLLNVFAASVPSNVNLGDIPLLSGNWNSTYTTVSENSAEWATYDYVYSNYLNLTGGSINGSLTINGNLTALGNSYFVDTIFTTTSALSVVNVGVGPALYVFQAAGPYDIASFYDGDGVEVLHVGNAQPGGGGFVGINESYPGAALTVNGNISGNGNISVVSMQASNNVGIGIYPPGYFNLDVSGSGNGTIGNSYGNLGLGSSGDISIYPNNNLLLGPIGNVGVGTTTPSVKLTVNGAISSNGTITTDGGNSNNWNSTYTTVNAYSASWEETIDIIPTVTNYLSTNNVFLSSAKVTDDINVGGTGYFRHIAASTKSFYIPHPLDSSKHLQYGSLESPYHGVRLTGKDKIQKECRIILPNYIRNLVKEDGINVQITNINHTQQLFVKSVDIDNNCIIIGRKYNLLNKNEFYEFYWSFTAIRKDIPDLQIEI